MSRDSRPGDEMASPSNTSHWAVIFTNRLTEDAAGYEAAAERMLELAREQPGFLGVESTRGSDGFGITISYWTDRAAIAAWRAQAEHTLVQAQGRARWYDRYRLRVARIESETAFERDAAG